MKRPGQPVHGFHFAPLSKGAEAAEGHEKPGEAPHEVRITGKGHSSIFVYFWFRRVININVDYRRQLRV